MGQAGRQQDSVAKRQGRLGAQTQRSAQRLSAGSTVVDVEPPEPAGMLIGQAAPQPLRRRRTQIRDLAVTGGHRALADQHQPRRGHLGCAQPALHQIQRGIQPGAGRGDQISTGVGVQRGRSQHDLRSRGAGTDRLDQRAQIPIAGRGVGAQPTDITDNSHRRRRRAGGDRHRREPHGMQRLRVPAAARTGQRTDIDRTHHQLPHIEHRDPRLISSVQPQPGISAAQHHP